MFMCYICDKYFSKKCNLYRHFKSHSVSKDEVVKLPYERIEFSNFPDFLKWKGSIEIETASSYIKRRKEIRAKNDIDAAYIYYDCLQSNYETKVGRTSNITNTRGKEKVRTVCSSRMHAIIAKGKIVVKYFKEHNHITFNIQSTTVIKAANLIGLLDGTLLKKAEYDKINKHLDGAISLIKATKEQLKNKD